MMKSQTVSVIFFNQFELHGLTMSLEIQDVF